MNRAKLNAALILENAGTPDWLGRVYSTAVAEELIAANCPFLISYVAAARSSAKGLSISDAIGQIRQWVRPSMLALPDGYKLRNAKGQRVQARPYPWLSVEQ